jgi:hypothetical protein
MEEKSILICVKHLKSYWYNDILINIELIFISEILFWGWFANFYEFNSDYSKAIIEIYNSKNI